MKVTEKPNVPIPNEHQALPSSSPFIQSTTHAIVGTHPKMHRVFKDIRKLADTDAPVLIMGESGVGKELAASAIHQVSGRARGPFVAVNCGAIPANLIQSVLFGYEKGAFTGAHRRNIGHIEAANGGTIFLDEIGDLSLELQVNLLRFLQEKAIERLGSTETIRANARVISATHRNLRREVEEGRFREDLFYRLNVLSLEIPPLRERKDDIEALAHFYFQKLRKQSKSQVRGFSPQALKAMTAYPWPGNVRELINRVQRAVVMCEGQVISPVDLGFDDIHSDRNSTLTLAQARANAEKMAIKTSLHCSRYNITQAARRLGIARMTLYRLMEKHELRQ